MRWFKDETVEQKLKSLGCEFSFRQNIPYKKINIKKGLKNNARLFGSSINDETALRYGIAMEEGDDFPAPVLFVDGNRLGILGGNHRLHAFAIFCEDLSAATIDAYVLETDDIALLELVTRTLNTVNGLPCSKDEQVQHAIALLEKWPSMSQLQIAKHLGLKQEEVSKARRILEIKNLLDDRNINTARIPKTVLLEIGKVKQNEAVMATLADLTIRHSIKGDEVREHVQALKRKRSESAQMRYLGEIDEQLEIFSTTTPGTKKRVIVKRKIMNAFIEIIKILPTHPTPAHLGLTSLEEVSQARRLWEETKQMCEQVFGQ